MKKSESSSESLPLIHQFHMEDEEGVLDACSQGKRHTRHWSQYKMEIIEQRRAETC